jgi:putative glutamine amidotransferase
MSIRIGIPEPTTGDAAYNARSLPPYLAALQSAGMTPVVIPLHERQDRVARLLAGTQGVLLPGSGFDVDPERYGEERIPACGAADPGRTAVDELLLQDAFNLHKPILAICHGAQTLNIWLNGSLIQDLKTVLNTQVDHAPGRALVNAHPIRIAGGSRLASVAGGILEQECNSSHHQAIGRVGDNLLVTAFCPIDNVIEAVELNSADHFVLGVQWHPERTYVMSSMSRAIFAAFAHAAEAWRPRPIEVSVAAV